MKYYNSIENIPCSVFDKILETGDYERLIIKKAPGKKPDFELVWEKIYDEFIQEFGVADKLKKYLQLMSQICDHYNNAYNNNQMHELNFARVLEVEAEALFKDTHDTSNMYAQVSKYMGFRCNPAEITVKELYGYLKLAQNG